ITGFAFANRSRRYLLVGWLWFLGTLVPMVEFVQVGNHAMADRYAYVPYVGLFIATCWGVADLAMRWRFAKVWVPAVTVAVLVLLAFASQRQVSYWSDDLNLWSHSAAAVKNNSMAEEMIGETLLQRGDSEAAMVHFR